ncbi:MAG: protein phosphatase 2C domain-containing protein [Roseburia sp.]|nr:protein phosphatase 2C domain-containing protein [Roseburia sp.]
MMGGIWAALGIVCFFILAAIRFAFLLRDINIHQAVGNSAKEGICQTTGSRENQADRAQVWKNTAGTMAVLADGIGSANTGMLCAQIAVDTILDRFEPYKSLNDPIYFFKTAFYEANRHIQDTIGERNGGASAGAVFMDKTHLYYAAAGNVRIAILRGEELIPLSRGQTMDVLAAQAYEEGKISRQEAIWSMGEKRIWNYLGGDGFHEIEVCHQPIRLKQGDKVLLVSKGIFEELSWREMEDILLDTQPPQKLAERLVFEAERKENPEKDNGSVIVIGGGRF